ncbi:2,3-bisphosphoglycerate-dependent phosphoglycerate mutase [Rubripirellula lacrimiformis]|uniref:2,3-bisphosphoglycerate-dependent phosphoglycerate mutase n=1 Tax=Rubripirellula lacrimiformis TaxID=1930273 RepID=A0A517N4U2_9BACT|nr:2,3-diphosphoglycerate-dependent phosphoglycerate mutase [Rubripirellula lacrimiformis]QDT02153.1 2,3-bisphosphoglycerate-dependent phosphoglycerate mutase [Rubripirellula lacrimiformis]
MNNPSQKTLVLLRHGQSVWNLQNRFTGWTDVGLSDQGHAEAIQSGRRLATEGIQFDIAFTSVLKRAIKTLWLALEEMDQMWIPVQRSWRLNERHYGSLQGEFKHEMAERVGEEQVQRWRRSFDVRPPLLTVGDKRFPGCDPRYAKLRSDQLPLGESLKDTIERTLPYWHRSIVPAFDAANRVLIVAHGNTLRALVKYLDNVSDDEIVHLDIPTGVPIVIPVNDAIQPATSIRESIPSQLSKHGVVPPPVLSNDTVKGSDLRFVPSPSQQEAHP